MSSINLLLDFVEQLREQKFDSFDQWVSRASRRLTSHPLYNDGSKFHWDQFKALCFDTDGTIVKNGGDFQRARDEGKFPIHWVWPDQMAEVAAKIAAMTSGRRLPTQFCATCGKRLNVIDDPIRTVDCGGDCLECMAVAGDPDCVASMREYYEEKLSSLPTTEEAAEEDFSAKLNPGEQMISKRSSIPVEVCAFGPYPEGNREAVITLEFSGDRIIRQSFTRDQAKGLVQMLNQLIDII